MTNEEFWEWYEEFHAKHGGIMPSETWPDRVHKNHEALRKLLNGEEKKLKIALENVQFPVDPNITNPYYNQLNIIIPTYFKQYALGAALFKYPMINEGDFKGIKVTKHIQHWLHKNPLNDKEKSDKIAKILSELGGKWTNAKSKKYELEVLLSTTPKAFALLGHYHSDMVRGSCFKQVGAHQRDKYSLGCYPNSFVILAGQEAEISDQNYKIMARMWGIANKDLDTFYLSNIYMTDKEIQGNIYKSVEKYIAELLGAEKVSVAEKKIKIYGVYKNPEDLAVSSKSVVDFSEFVVEPASLAAVCQKCKGYGRNLRLIDGISACAKCIKTHIGKCAISGKETFNLYTVYNEEGKQIRICSEVYSKDFIQCIDGYVYPKKCTITVQDGTTAPIHKLKDLRIHQCKKCNQYYRTSKCQKCATSNQLSKENKNDYSYTSPTCYTTTSTTPDWSTASVYFTGYDSERR